MGRFISTKNIRTSSKFGLTTQCRHVVGTGLEKELDQAVCLLDEDLAIADIGAGEFHLQHALWLAGDLCDNGNLAQWPLVGNGHRAFLKSR